MHSPTPPSAALSLPPAPTTSAPSQHQQKRHPRGGGGRLGRADCTGAESCAVHRPGLVGRRTTDRDPDHGRQPLWIWRRCLHQQWHGDLLIVHHHWQHGFRRENWWRCRCPGWHSHDNIFLNLWEYSSIWRWRWCRCQWWHSGHLIVHHQWEHSTRWIWRRCLSRWHGDLLSMHHHWQHSFFWRRCLCRERHGDLFIVLHH